MRKITVLSIFALLLVVANAQISRYVMVEATGDGTGTSWANAAGTADIQTVIDEVEAAPDQGTVYFAAGTYLIPAQIQLKNNVQLMGGYAADGSGVRDLLNNQTILDGQFNKRILFTGDQAPHVAFDKVTKVDGFVLQRGSSSYGSAVAMSVGTVLENCIIRNNNGSTYGAAVFIKRHATLTNPTAGWNFGGALINCIIINNTSSDRAAAVFVNQDTHFSMVNCVIANNKSTDAVNGVGGVLIQANIRFSRIANTIFYTNTSPVSGRNNAWSPTTNYAAIWANYFSDDVIPLGFDAVVTNASPGHGNMTAVEIASPGFVQPTTFDGHAGADEEKTDEIYSSNWRLHSTSPLIGLGTNPLGRADIPYPYVSPRFNGVARSFATVTTDIMGSDRVINTTVEMGAYEYNPVVVTTATADASMGSVSTSVTVSKGTAVTVLATPEVGYVFTAWSDGENDVSDMAEYSFVPMADVTLTAHFEADLGTSARTENVQLYTIQEGMVRVYAGARAELYSIAGQRIAEINANQSYQISEKGVYIIRIITRDQLTAEKFLIE